jgi:hypothetical protein
MERNDVVAIIAAIVVSSGRDFDIPRPGVISKTIRHYPAADVDVPATRKDLKDAVRIARIIYEEAGKSPSTP